MGNYEILFILIIVIIVIGLVWYNLNILRGWKNMISKFSASPEDTREEILNKLEELNLDTNSDIMWNRNMTFAMVASFTGLVFLTGIIPSIRDFLVAMLLIFIVFYFMESWFNSHVIGYRRGRIRKIINEMKNLA